jgi:hypothetical protein
MVYRNEWMERNLCRDHDIENLRDDAVRDVTNLQRQFDQQWSDFQVFSNSLGNGRDFITDLRAEQSRLRDQIAALPVPMLSVLIRFIPSHLAPAWRSSSPAGAHHGARDRSDQAP